MAKSNEKQAFVFFKPAQALILKACWDCCRGRASVFIWVVWLAKRRLVPKHCKKCHCLVSDQRTCMGCQQPVGRQ